MNYKRLSIRTTFNGVFYRSRIEAFFAAYMNMLPNVFTRPMYEVYSVDGYKPDFDVSIEMSGCVFHCVLEIKPDIRMADFSRYQKCLYKSEHHQIGRAHV